MLFSPWAWMVARVLHTGGFEEKLGWITRPTLSGFTWFFVDLTGCADHLNFLLAKVVVIAILLLAYRRPQETGIHWLTVLAIVPAFVLFAASQWLPLWGHRHLIFTFWPFLIILAVGLCRLPRSALAGIILLIGFWGAFVLELHRVDDRKLPWDTLTIGLLDQERSGSPQIPLYSIDRDMHFPLWFYMESLKTGKLGPFGPHLVSRTDIPELAAKAARFEISKIKSLNDVRAQYFWLGYSDSDGKAARAVQEVLSRRGCRTGDVISASDRFHSAVVVAVQCQ